MNKNRIEGVAEQGERACKSTASRAPCPSMKTHLRKLKHKDKILIAAKRERQAKSRALVESGERSQESMFFIAPSMARAAKVRHRVLSFG